MPNGRTHAAITTLLAVGVTTASVTLIDQIGPLAAAGLSAGAWLELIVDPDLDHHVLTNAEHRMLRFSPIFGGLWVWYWSFYHRQFTHRDNDTHSWPIGTAIRFFYALWPLLLLSTYYLGLTEDLLRCWFALFIGLSFGDIGHILADKLWDFGKVVGLR